MNIKEAIQQAILELHASPSARIDTELLLAHVIHGSRIDVIRCFERPLSLTEIEAFQRLVRMRKSGYPIAYLVEKKPFWTLTLSLVDGVFIPRPETELLVETILNAFPDEQPRRLIDLGTGSGAIALAIAFERPGWDIIATDISSRALQTAKDNATRHHIDNVSFVASDWFSAIQDIGRFDIIVSNPPYIAIHEISTLPVDVWFEPKQALLSLSNGLQDIAILVDQARSFLKPQSHLFLEHGAHQGESVRTLFLQNGYQSVLTYQDLASLDRVTCGCTG